MITTHDGLAIGNADGDTILITVQRRRGAQRPKTESISRHRSFYGLGILRQGDTKTKPTKAFRTASGSDTVYQGGAS
jgi:hypothetical protein